MERRRAFRAAGGLQAQDWVVPFIGGLGMGIGRREERRWWSAFDRLGFEVQVIT